MLKPLKNIPVGIPVTIHNIPGSCQNVFGTSTLACAMAKDSKPSIPPNTANARTLRGDPTAKQPLNEERVSLKIFLAVKRLNSFLEEVNRIIWQSYFLNIRWDQRPVEINVPALS